MNALLQSVVAALKKSGLLGGPKALVWLQFGLPLLILIVGIIVGRAKLKKGNSQAKGGNSPVPKEPKRAQPQYELKEAWRRFLRRLPPIFRRSILNFDQIVILGDSRTGKSWLVDTFTDWRKQARQFAGGEGYDPALQVYLTSSSVIMEVPAWVLEDHSEKCRRALTELWRSVYRKREPTVVVTIDTERLEKGEDEIVAYAEALRAKINILARLRRRPVEVRLAVTRMDRLEGHTAFAEFCRIQGVPTRLVMTGPPSAAAEALSGWVEEMRGHIPRALTTSSSVDFRQVVAFLRQLPSLVPSLSRFVETLFADDPLSPTPRCGGVYLAMSPAGPNSPLERNVQAEAGPDPRRPHWIAATVAASAILGYLVLAYRAQWTLWDQARQAWKGYEPATAAREDEREAREAITRFGYKEDGFIYRFPNFFGKAAAATREKLSNRLREEVLVPGLRAVAVSGTTEAEQLSIPRRRSLYYVALIHSDRNDRFKFLDPARLGLVASMTGLDPELIVDFIRSTDRAYSQPVSFEFATPELDPNDRAAYWLSYFEEIQDVIAGGVATAEELHSLQTRAAQLLDALRRFEHDDVTLGLFDRLYSEGRTDGNRASLRNAYRLKFEPLLRSLENAKIFPQREQIATILTAIKGDQLDKDGVTLLTELVARLKKLYPEGERVDEGQAEQSQPITVQIGGVKTTFEAKKWYLLIRDSRASGLVTQFVRKRAIDKSMFFTPEQEQLPSVVWNGTNDGTLLFIGKGSIGSRYTRAAYNANVREPVIQLAGVLERATIPEEQKQELVDHVREQVGAYAKEYRQQLLAFYKSYALKASSQEALRVILAQISSDRSPFLDFLTAVSRNTLLDVEHRMLEPMREVVTEFAPLHAIVGEEGATGEFEKYKAVVAQLLADLGRLSGAEGESSDTASAKGDGLQGELSPAGRIELANLRGEAGSYNALVSEWLGSVGLLDYQKAPFQAPLEQLARLGREDIERVVTRIWQREIRPELIRLKAKFPFDPAAKDEVTPSELTSVLHPQSGKVFEAYRRYIEPLAELNDGALRERRSIRGKLKLPSDLFPMMNRAATLSGRFWNEAGEPTPLTLRIATVPFEHGPSPKAALTLIYLNAGESSVFNFNQKPSIVTVSLDWTKEYASQVGIQLTNLETRENLFPEPVVVEGSFWSFFRLLKKAEMSAVRQPANARLYSWAIRHRREGTDRTVARFVVLDDPWESFGDPEDAARKLTLGAVN